MFNNQEIEIANKTSRNSSAVGGRAITPRFVNKHLEQFYDKKTTLILDFGAGKDAAHTKAMIADGWNCTAYEFGNNVNPFIHDKTALDRQYDVIFASNVLNVQSGLGMARDTIKQIAKSLKDHREFFANYPITPRKSDISVTKMESLLAEQFKTVTRIAGTNKAPLWLCGK